MVKTIYTKLKIGEAPCVTMREGPLKKRGGGGPTSDDMRSNLVGLGGGTRIPINGKNWLNPISGC